MIQNDNISFRCFNLLLKSSTAEIVSVIGRGTVPKRSIGDWEKSLSVHWMNEMPQNNIFHSFIELMATSKGKARSSETVGELWVNAGWFPCMMTPMRKAKCSLKTCLFLTTTSTTNFKFIQSQMIKCCYFLSISHEQHFRCCVLT